MPNRFNIQHEGKGRGLLTAYILHSLKKEPKSGYELLAEIKEKTKGSWTPSKGTIYPLLKHLQEEELIKIKSIDKRSKHIFEITSEGKKLLRNIKKYGKKMEERFIQSRKLMQEVMGKKDTDMTDKLFEMRAVAFSIKESEKNKVIKILDNCLGELKKVSNSKITNRGEIK